MATAARLPLAADRVGACVRTIEFVGLDLTSVDLRMQVRLRPDTPGDPLIDLLTVTNANAEGVRLVGVVNTNGVPTSTVQLRINETTMENSGKVPYSGEPGTPSVLSYDLIGVFGNDKRRLMFGEFVALPTTYGADNAPSVPSEGVAGAGGSYATWSAATLTFGNDVVRVSVDGATLIGSFVQQATDAALLAQSARAGAEAVRDTILEALSALTPTAADLLGSEAGFAIEACGSAPDLAVKAVGNGKDYSGDLRGWLPTTVFPNPKLVINEKGEEVYSPHNIIYATSALDDGGNWTKLFMTVADGVTSPTGRTASKLTATNGTASVRQDVDVGAANVGDPLTCAVIASVGSGAGAGSVLKLRIGALGAFFNLATGVVSNVDAGVTATISRTDADGTMLAEGEYLCAIYGTWLASSASFRIVVVDAPGAETATAGTHIFVRQPRASRGTRAMPFMPRGGFPAAMPVGVPYDWSRVDAAGVRQRRIVIDAADKFLLPASILPTFRSLYAEGEVEVIGTPSDFQILEASSGSNSQTAFLTYSGGGTAMPYLAATAISDATYGCTLGELASMAIGNVLAASIGFGDGSNSFCVNGDVAHTLENNAPAATVVRLGGNPNNPATHRFYLKALIGLTRRLSFEEQSAWQDGQRLHPVLRSSSVIRYMDQTPNVDRSREPVAVSLGDTPTGSKLLTLALERNVNGSTFAEVPARIVFTRFEVSLTGELTRVDDGVLAQPTGWASGRGHAQSAAAHKIRYGRRKGELFFLVSMNQNDPYAGDDTVRSLYRYRSKDNMASLSEAGTLALSPTALGTGVTYIIPDPSGRMVEFAPDSAYPLRLLTMVYYGESLCRAVWSDDQGATLQYGAPVPNGGNEATVSLLPDGRLVTMMRIETAPFKRYSYSADGGATWSTAADVPGFLGQAVSGSLTQLDPEGVFSTFGRVAHAHSRALNGARAGTQIDFYEADALSIHSSLTAVPILRSAGYCSIASLRGGEFVAVAVETSRDGSFNDRCGTFVKIIEAGKASDLLSVPPPPMPSFATQPTVSPASGSVGQTFTATAGSVSNGAITSRAWRLNGTSISTGLTASPNAAGTLTYQEFAGSVGSTIRSITVAAVQTPDPSFTAQPTVAPTSGTAGQTFTATAGTVANGSITSRAWKLDGTTISTGLTATPSAAGTLTYQEFAGPTASTIRTIVVSAVATPSFTAQPTVTPTSGTVGQAFTATPGTVANGSVTGREWRFGGSVVSTGTSYTALAAGTLTYQEFASSVASALRSITVSPAAAALPKSSDIVAKWSADTLPVIANGATVPSWTDEVGGNVATSLGVAVTYKTSSENGKPTTVWIGGSTCRMEVSSPTAALLAALNSQNNTVLMVVKNPNHSPGNFPNVFSASAGGDSLSFVAGADFVGRNKNGPTLYVPTPTGGGMFTFGGTSTTDASSGSGNGLERAYVEGGCVASFVGPMPATGGNKVTIGNLVGAPAVGYFGYGGEIAEIIVWKTTLTPVEVLQFQKWYCDKYAKPLPWSAKAKYTLFHGDSITAGVGIESGKSAAATYPYKAAQTLGLPYGAWSNLGIGGISMPNMAARASVEVDPTAAMTGVPTHLAVFEWYNQRGVAPTPENASRAYLAARAAAGINKITFGTSTDEPVNQTNRAAYNSAFVNNHTDSQAFVPIHLNSVIGQAGASTNQSNFDPDAVHPREPGYTVLASLFAAQMATL